MVPYARAILAPPTPNHHHAMLLYIMPLAGNICRHHAPATEPHLSGLALPGIRLLRLRDPDLQTHALHLRAADHGGRERAARFLRPPRLVADLVQGGGAGGGGGEGEGGGGG